MSSHDALRILDAALNRAGEGLRVVEDYVRFELDDGHLTGEVKRLRHELAEAARGIPAADRHAARDTPGDVGTTISTAGEGRREDAWGVCQASLERTKQSLRSLEEFAKVGAPELGARFESLRYWLYTLEAAVGRTVDAVERLGPVRLYVLVDGGETEERFESFVRELAGAEVDAIQLRDKGLSDRDLKGRALLLRSIALQPRALPGGDSEMPANRLRDPRAEPGAAARRPIVIINDRPDIAVAVDADGVQLGQNDMSVRDARAIVGPRKLIGVSTHSIEQARAAVLDGANYIGVGPTFPSATKSFDEFPGLDLLRQVAGEIRLPAFAIGGIHLENAADVLATGFTRIAVSSAIAAAQAPTDVARKLKALLASTG